LDYAKKGAVPRCKIIGEFHEKICGKAVPTLGHMS
jgi:hypothetical protein